MPPVFIQFSNLELPVLPIGQIKLGGLKCPIYSKHYLHIIGVPSSRCALLGINAQASHGVRVSVTSAPNRTRN